MKKFLLIFFGGISCVFLGIAAWFSYSFNAGVYREKIIHTISQLTGRTVEITGDVSLTWSPFPVINISGLRISNQEKSSEPIMFSVERIHAEIDWGSLLKEPLVVKKVILEKPAVLVERLHRYETNFDFPILFKTVQNIDPTFLMGQNNFDLSVRDVEIKDGVFTYCNIISGEKVTFSGIEGTGIISSLEGPFSFSGKIVISEKPFNLDVQIGQIEVSQDIPITINLTDPASDTSIESKGHIIQDMQKPDEWLNLSGILTSTKGAQFFQNLGIDKWPEGSSIMSFTIKIKTDKTVIENMTVRQGEGDSETSFTLGMELEEKTQKKIPTLGIKSMDYQKWKPLLIEFSKGNFLDKITTDFAVLIKEIRVNSGILTQGIAKGHIENGIVNFSEFVIELPQGSSFGMKGVFDPRKLSIDADIQLQTANFRGLMEWFLENEKIKLPEKGLGNAQFVGHVVASSNHFSSDINVGLLGEAQFSGALDISRKENLELDAKLEVKNLNLDTYYNFDFGNLKDINLPKGDFIFDLKLEDFKFHDNNFKIVNILGKSKDDVLQLERLFFEKEGNSSVEVSGEIQNFRTSALRFQDLKVNFKNFDLENVSSQNSLFKQLKHSNGDLLYTGSVDGGNFNLNLFWDKTELKAFGEIVDPLKSPKILNTDVSIFNPEIQNFLGSFYVLKDRFPLLSGKMNMAFKAESSLEHFVAKNIALYIDQQSLNGEVDLNLKEKQINVNFVSPDFDLNKIFPNFEEIKKQNFNFDFSSDWQVNLQLKLDKFHYDLFQFNDFKSKLNFNNKNLSVASYSFSLPEDKGKISGSGNIVLKNPIVADGKFYFEKVAAKDFFNFGDFVLSDGLLNLEGNFIVSGNTWNDFLKTVRSQGKLSWENGILSGIDMKVLSSVVEKELKQTGNDIDTQINHVIFQGKTPIDNTSASFLLEQGNFSCPEIKLVTFFGDIFVRHLNKSLLNGETNAMVAVILNLFQSFPSLDIQIHKGKSIVESKAFEKALKQEINFIQEKQAETKEKEVQQKAYEEQQEILSEARTILEIAETRARQLKNVLSLRPSNEANELIQHLEETLEEVRTLAMRPDLNAEQLVFLQKKSNLLSSQSQDLSDYLEQQEVLRQREAIKKLPPLVKTRLEEMIQLYNQNPESPIFAGLVEGSQKEEEKINKFLVDLEKVKDLNTANEIINEIKESFKKIQKALTYARQFNSMNEIIPRVSGVVSEGEN